MQCCGAAESSDYHGEYGGYDDAGVFGAVGIIFGSLAIGALGFIMNIYTDKPEIQQIGISYLRIVGFAYVLHVLEFSRHFRWNRVFIRQYLQKGFPIICNEVLIGVGNMMINIVLGHQSEKAIAREAGRDLLYRCLDMEPIHFF